MYTAAYLGFSGGVQAFLNRKVHPNDPIKEDSQNTALHFAVNSGDLKCINTLLDAKASISAVNAEGKQPLRSAFNNIVVTQGTTKDLQIVELLLTHKADPNHADKWGGTVLDFATIIKPAILELLLEYRANPSNTRSLILPHNNISATNREMLEKQLKLDHGE